MNTFCAFQLQCIYYSVTKLNLEITVLILQATFKLFCGAFTQVYGETFAVYNVHGLIHLGEDMRFGSSLNGISFFLFENYFQILKKFVWNWQKPVVQVAKRISDISFAGGIRFKKKLNYTSPRQKDNCFLMDNKNIVFIKKKINESHFLCNQIDISTLRSRIDGWGSEK